MGAKGLRQSHVMPAEGIIPYTPADFHARDVEIVRTALAKEQSPRMYRFLREMAADLAENPASRLRPYPLGLAKRCVTRDDIVRANTAAFPKRTLPPDAVANRRALGFQPCSRCPSPAAPSDPARSSWLMRQFFLTDPPRLCGRCRVEAFRRFLSSSYAGPLHPLRRAD